MTKHLSYNCNRPYPACPAYTVCTIRVNQGLERPYSTLSTEREIAGIQLRTMDPIVNKGWADVPLPVQAHLWYEYVRDPEGFLIGPPMDLPRQLRDNITRRRGSISPHSHLALNEWVYRNNIPAENLWVAGMYPKHPLPLSKGKIIPYTDYTNARRESSCVGDEWIMRNLKTGEIGTQQQRLSVFFEYVIATVEKRIQQNNDGRKHGQYTVVINIRMEETAKSSVEGMIQSIKGAMLSLPHAKILKKQVPKNKKPDRFITLDEHTTKIGKEEVRWKFQVGPGVGKPYANGQCIFQRRGEGDPNVLTFDWVPGKVEKLDPRKVSKKKKLRPVALPHVRTPTTFSVLHDINIDNAPEIPKGSPFSNLKPGCYTMNDKENHLCITENGYSALHHFHPYGDKTVQKFNCQNPECSLSVMSE